ncbi:hypothetical protein GCM10007377_07580 [Galliscardovia ingluviei]|uniref:HAD family hydrolase n=1 Tax=Galliscardovia ingluviei TaxID=1769422 RepID=A0A8J3EY30_9BIFI|nr:hypothetical protein GCM10007377_07580 [Galliscardovia ingluviei]
MSSWLASEQPLCEAYQLALVDLDGVVYVGKLPIDYAASALIEAEQHGMNIEYTTNNSSRYQSVVAEQLQSFHLPVEPWQVITSSVVAARMVAHHVPQGSPVLAVGAPHLQEEVERAGLKLVHTIEEHPVAVIQGWYPEITWNELATAAFAVEQGASYFVTNRDLTIPREHGVAPGCGSLIQAVINATGVEPVDSAGKPGSAMYDEARGLVAEHQTQQYTTQGVEPIAIRQCLAVGDRLDTDIEAANRGGYDSLLVLTGVTDARMLMLAQPILRPTYVSRDLRGLLGAHHAVQRLDDGVSADGAQTGHSTERIWQCGRAIVRVSVHRLQAEVAPETREAYTSREALASTHAAFADGSDSIDNAGSMDNADSMGNTDGLDLLRAASQACWYELDHAQSAVLKGSALEEAVDHFVEQWYPNGRDLRNYE